MSFDWLATNLVPGDTNGEMFLAPALSDDGSDLSGDGRFVAFTSRDPSIVANDTNGTSDVFTRAVRGERAP